MKFARHPLALSLLLAAAPAFADNADLDSLRAELAKQRELIAAQQKQIDALGENAGNTGTDNSATTLGMYGEVHYNNLRSEDENIHAHRVVLLVNHRFREGLNFFSEVEFEGAPDSTEIETELEQFGINLQLKDDTWLTLGQFLVPVGLLNESHEPEVFYGVERNPVEEFIIPATWWEKGAMLGGRLGNGLTYDIAVHAGLRGDINTLGTADGLREFRQEFGGAVANDLAWTGRLKWLAKPGVEFGIAAQHQPNITQADDPLTGGEAPAQLLEAHTVLSHDAFTLRALYATWRIDNSIAENNGTDELSGWYVEPAWKATEKIGVFARYNNWNTAANAAGSEDNEQTNVGINYLLDRHVVLKADVQDTNRANNAGDGFNLGFGLSF